MTLRPPAGVDDSYEPDTWKEASATTGQSVVDPGSYQVDLELGFANEDQPGYIWTWLDAARDTEQIVPGAVLTLRDGKDLAMGQVVDLVTVDNGVIVHLQLLPGAVGDHHAAIEGRFV